MGVVAFQSRYMHCIDGDVYVDAGYSLDNNQHTARQNNPVAIIYTAAYIVQQSQTTQS